MRSVNMHEAKTDLSRLVNLAVNGEPSSLPAPASRL
jgi:antitoxin (DNA-binding transcriptional repressor) of toxin-antitoxin stability system